MSDDFRRDAIWDEQAEQFVITELMQGFDECYPQIGDLVGGDFFEFVHRDIFLAMQELQSEGEPIDPIMIANRLRGNNLFESLGGPQYLIDLLHKVGDARLPHRVPEWSRLVRETALRRKLKRDFSALEQSMASRVDFDGLRENLRKLAESLPGGKAKAAKTLEHHMLQVVADHAAGKTPAKWWGIPAIDEQTLGIALGELVLIGARPSHGKSLIGLQWLRCASEKGIAGLMISEEMTAISLATRAMSSFITIQLGRDTEEAGNNEVREHWSDKAPIWIAEKCSTMNAVERAIEQAVRNHGVQIVAVDYAQLIRGNGDNKEQRVGDVSSRLKSAAVQHDIIVLLLAQLNRGIESRDDPIPQLSDFRDSGSLENDADVALFPYWPWQIDNDYGKADTGVANATEYRIYQRKNRNRGYIRRECLYMMIDPARQMVRPEQRNRNERQVDYEHASEWR